MSPDQPTDQEAKPDIQGLFKVWIDSDLKVQLLVFFHENPGVMETVEGLARRLGLNAEVLSHEIADHVHLGILRERPVGDKKVILYNRGIERQVEEVVRRAVEAKMKEAQR